MELDTYAFVQGIAIDLAEDGKNIDLTIQFYKPTSVGKGQAGGPSGQSLINIKTKDITVFEAIRDMTIHFGRKAQWSHMRVLIIGEEIAKKRNIGEIVDFFARDHEPRSTVSVMIGKDRADLYLKKGKPFIESTMGQQLRESERMAYEYTGKSLKTSFLDLMMELKGETGVAAIPYLYFDPKNKPATSPVTGLALMKKGKLISTISSKKIESLLILMDKYRFGIIQLACPGESKKKMKKVEAIEVESAKTKLDVKIKGDSAAVHVSTKIKGYSGELVCTTLITPEDVAKYNERVKKLIERDLKSTVAYFQEQKLDVIGIGNRVYRQDPAQWKRWKPNWEERFASIPFTFEVEVSVINTGANLGIPVAK
ncbi:Ger(x)C family spore germination protein [Paenibacillus sp. LMG 31460]|uniref:Ger(X)C family spore germination protein n=2 Tax=Paenibacillus germinis TaxID=2654979 RepID=A0ABX1ZB88_9BACL|nr:Ger(x)C family spore germination protein [Paenibacillus germinis]